MKPNIKEIRLFDTYYAILHCEPDDVAGRRQAIAEDVALRQAYCVPAINYADIPSIGKSSDYRRICHENQK